MDHARRLTIAAIVWLALPASLLAATVPATREYLNTYTNTRSVSAAEACASSNSDNGQFSCTAVSIGGNMCHASCTNGYEADFAMATGWRCSVPSLAPRYVEGSQVPVCDEPDEEECPSGQTRDPATGQCKANCTSGRKLGPSFTDIVPRCLKTPTGNCMAMPTVVTSPKGTYYRYLDTGQACTSTDAPPPPETEDEESEACKLAVCPPKSDGGCGAGYTAGQINGTSLCTKDTKDTSTTTSPGNGAGQGPSTTEATTQCKGDKCTTTTTTVTTNPDGTSGGSTTTTVVPRSTYCADKPTSAACAEDGSDESMFGGSCSGGFACDGDAVQCAMAREQYMRNCLMFDVKTSPVVQAAEAAVIAGDRPEGHPALNPTEVSFSGASINQTNPYGTECPDDIQFLAAGRSITIPLAEICPYLRVAGYCLVAMSLWFAFRTASEAL